MDDSEGLSLDRPQFIEDRLSAAEANPCGRRCQVEKQVLRSFLFRLIFNHMVEYSSRLLDRTFGALADPTRRRILAQLAKGDGCVTDLARPHAMSLAAVPKHLIVLEKAGLVKRRRSGRVHSLALEAKPMKEAQAWIDRYRKFWEANLDQFENYLEKLQTKEKP